MYALIYKPTRVTSSSPALIDNHLTNYLNNVANTGMFYTDIFDHFPIFHFSLAAGNEQMGMICSIRCRIFNKSNCESFTVLIGDIS
jgi:hypothetical protein